MKLSKNHIIPIAIFLFALILRIGLISKGPYHGDTIALIIQAEKTIETLQLQKQSALGFPFMVILASLFIYLFKFFSWGTTALAVNTISVLFSSLAVFGFYYLSLEMVELLKSPNLKGPPWRAFQRLTALIASLVLSLSPIFLGISVYGKSHAPCLCFLIGGTYFLLNYQRTNKQNSFWLSILCLGLMGATRILDLFLISIPLSFLFIAQYPHKKTSHSLKTILLRFLLWWGTIVLCISLFYLPYFLQERIEKFTTDLNGYLNHALFNNFIGIFSFKLITTFQYLVKNFTYPGLFLCLGGLLFLIKQNGKLFTFLLLWIICPTLYYGNLYMTMTSRYFVIILPPLIFGMAYIFASFRDKNLFFKSMAFFLLFAITITTFLRIYPLLKRRHDFDDVPSFARWFKKTAAPNAQIIHGDGSAFFQYYTNVIVASRPLSANPIKDSKLEEFRLETNKLITEGTPIYIDSVGLFAYNCQGSFSKYVYKHYDWEYLGSHYYEDWHGGALEDRRIELNVYKLSIKNETN